MSDLPADDHVHSQWSWDADHGSMLATCARAVALGLPSVSFTEHVDHTLSHLLAPYDAPAVARWVVDDELRLPALDVEGYLASVEECRERFPTLRIRTGVELGEPHRHKEACAALLAGGRFERVLASLHCSRYDGRPVDVLQLMALRPPAEVLTGYLEELLVLVETAGEFQVLAHVDYAVRAWPAGTPYDVTAFAEPYRAVLRALATRGRALELNTTVPLDPTVLRWWRELGGDSLSFASDAHEPERLARGFSDAVHRAEAAGFRPGRDPLDLWRRD